MDVTVRIPRSLHKQVSRLAARDGVSPELYCKVAIAIAVAQQIEAEHMDGTPASLHECGGTDHHARRSVEGRATTEENTR